MDQHALYLFAAFAVFAAGAVKGAVGFGLPTASLGLLTLAVDARTAIALVLIPMFLTNLAQFLRAGETARAIRGYAPYLACLAVGIVAAFLLTVDASERLLLGVLGAIIVLYVAVSFSGRMPAIPPHRDRVAQVVAGGLSGAMGGVVSIWAPPMVAYLTARNVPKDEFIRASGLILCVGSLPLIAGYLREGFLTPSLAAAATVLLIPTFAGVFLGERLRGRLSEAGFRRLLLVVFALLGLNLLRRALL